MIKGSRFKMKYPGASALGHKDIELFERRLCGIRADEEEEAIWIDYEWVILVNRKSFDLVEERFLCEELKHYKLVSMP